MGMHQPAMKVFYERWGLPGVIFGIVVIISGVILALSLNGNDERIEAPGKIQNYDIQEASENSIATQPT